MLKSRAFRLLVVCFWLIAGVMPASSAESHVELTSDGLNGLWLLPDRGWAGATVLLLHGFADDANGVGDLGMQLARDLAESGIATLRVNFRGEGDRSRTEILSTLQSRIADTETARAFVLRQPGVDPKRIGVQGFSLGASTAIETAARHPSWFRSMALWSSPSGDHFALYDDDERAQRALRDGVASVPEPGWKTITTRREFYESFRGVNLDRSLAKYPGAFLSVRGSEDYLPVHEADFLRIVRGRPAEAIVIGGADHIFKVFEPGAPLAQRAIEVTVAWFQRTM